MSQPVEGLQPDILRWARESAGLSQHEVATKLGREVSEIREWEAGSSAPTYPQLERLAYEVYKRPLAVFFLPAPPAERSAPAEFRTLPTESIESLSADTRYQIRLAKAFQLSLEELNEGKNPTERPIFRSITLQADDDAVTSARSIRQHLGFSVEDQRSTRTEAEALKAWRNAVENAGVYVFKSAFKQKRISGFCLQHPEFPVIYLNNSNAKPRQIFSLIHELVHLLLNINGISSADDDLTFGNYSPEQKRTEIFCNRVAAEVLLPSVEFEAELSRSRLLDDRWVAQIAARWRLSRELVWRRLLDFGHITREQYAEKARALNKVPDRDTGTGGGNYYATSANYMGERYMRLVFGKHYKGQLSLEEVADYLGVKTGSVAGLETMVLKGGGD